MNTTRMKLIFAVYGDSLNHQILTDVSGVSPTNTWYKGDLVNGKSTVTHKETRWEYSIGFVETLFLDEITTMFLRQFSASHDAIAQCIVSLKLESKVEIIVEVVGDTMPALSFDRELLEFIVKMNGEVDVDLYMASDT